YFGRDNEARTKARDYDLTIKKLKLKGDKVKKESEPALKEDLQFGQLAQLYLDDKRNDGWTEPAAYNFKSYMNRHVIPCIGAKGCG
ncbi:MAG: hypothetical protein GTN76_10785, partial [Candidatus Aenigmarchaeota archaeon]|nr:hypothetical protein [Candidatus Aenigmarchaeota archaeon]